MTTKNNALQSTLSMTERGLTSTYSWPFKTFFKSKAYGWKGSKLAAQRLREALKEIKKANKTDQVLASEGCIYLMSRFWPAFQHIDTSSGSLGNAVCSVMSALLPIIIAAPASLQMRQHWLDILWQILQNDGVDYVADIAEYWGELAVYPEEASRRADDFAFIVKRCWENGDSVVHFDTAYLSALFVAKRFEEILEGLKHAPYPSWWTRKFGARVLALTNIDEAIAYADDTRQIINTNQQSIDCFCEEVLITSGRIEEAYARYAIPANFSNTYLNCFNKIKKKYASIRTDEQILTNLCHSGTTSPGKWFATANKLKCFDLALELIKNDPADPITLNRAAKARLTEAPNYALSVALSSLKWMMRGAGYELTNFDVHNALNVIKQSAEQTHQWDDIKQQLAELVKTNPAGFYARIISTYL